MKDEDLRRMAERFVGGESVEMLAVDYEMNSMAVRRLLKMAKASFPEMDWPSRRAPSESPTAKYVEMKSGVPGTRGVPQGSIVRKHRL